ncbi:hypothetical protein D3C81_1396700 [compost metagenome]
MDLCGQPLLQQLAQADGAEQRTEQRRLAATGVLRAGRCPQRRDEQQAEAVLLGAAGEAQDGAGADLLAAQGCLEGVAARAGRGHVEPQRQVGDAARDAEQQREVLVASLQGLQVAGRVRFAQLEAAADQDFGAVAEGLQLFAAGSHVDLQQRRPGQRQIVAQQRLGELLEFGTAHLAGAFEEVAHAVQVALALPQAFVETAEALLGQLCEVLTVKGLTVVPELPGKQRGQGEAGEGQQAAEQPLAAPAA